MPTPQKPPGKAQVLLLHPTKNIEVMTSFAEPDLTQLPHEDAVLMVGAAMAKVVRWGGHLREPITVGHNALALYGAARCLERENDELHLAALLYGCEAAFGGEIQWGIAKTSDPWRAHQAACRRAVCAVLEIDPQTIDGQWGRIISIQSALTAAEKVAYGGRTQDPRGHQGAGPHANPDRLRSAYDAALTIGWRSVAAWWCSQMLTFGPRADDDLPTSWDMARDYYRKLGGIAVPGHEDLEDLGEMMEGIWTP